MLGPFRRVLRYLPHHRNKLVVGLAAIPMARGLDLFVPLVIGHALDGLSQGKLDHPLWLYFAAVIGLALTKGVAKFTMRYCVVGASRGIELELRDDLYRHLLTQPPSYFQRLRTGDVMARLTSDVETVRMFVGPGLMYITEAICILPPAWALLAFLDFRLAILLLVPLALIAWVMVHYAEPQHREAKRQQELLADLSNAAQENFAGIRVVRSFAREDQERARFDAASEAFRVQSLRAAIPRGRASSAMFFALDVGRLVLIAGGAYELIVGRLSVGDFFIFYTYLTLLLWPMVALGWMIGMAPRAKASMERLNELFDAPPAVIDPADAYRPAAVRGEVELRGLTIAYGDREVLKSVDLKIPAGKIVGVTGKTGSGKSTLAQALVRLVDIVPGQIFVDGVDATRWSVASLRRAIGYVPQEAFLFADTLSSNVGLGRDDRDEAPLWDALAAAEVDDEVRAIPGQLGAVVGERGVTLSGGQRQRATIARALAKDPRILVLDDCLSAVDAETEAEILKRLADKLAGRTALIVSHRVAALSLADEVVVLDDGRVVERGAPRDLLAKRGRYHELFVRQQAEEELDRMLVADGAPAPAATGSAS